MSHALTPAAPLGPGTTAVVALLATASLGITATAAYAAWSVNGSTTATARTATATALSLTVSAPTGLFPGASRAITVTVENPNEFPVRLLSATLGGLVAPAGCGASNATLGTFSGTLPTVAAQSTTTLTFTNGITLASNADNACQGVQFGLTASVTGESAVS